MYCCWLLLALLLGTGGIAPARRAARPQAQTPAVAAAHHTVAEAIAALGGDEYLQANERSGKGYLYTFNSAGNLNGTGTRFWSYFRFPADERLELTKKRNVVYIYRGGKGWDITFRGVQPMLPRALANYKAASTHALDVILKTWAADPETLMLDEGQGLFDQAQIDSVLFTTRDGVSATVDFALLTHLPVRVHWQRTDPDTGGRYVASVVYGNWANIGGIEAAFSVDRYQGPQRLEQRYYTGISFAPFSDSKFVPKPVK
ncbi:MAG: hypothetical protein ACRD0Y_03015 [Terriglobales bacterium]